MRSSSLFLVATADVVVAGLLTRSCQSYCDRLVMTGRGLLNYWHTCLGPCLQLPKSPYLISYTEIFWNKSKVPESSVTLVKTIVKHVTIHVWLYENHVWTLLVILPTRARFGAFSLIDDSRCAHAFSTTAPVCFITIILETISLCVNKWAFDRLNIVTYKLFVYKSHIFDIYV